MPPDRAAARCSAAPLLGYGPLSLSITVEAFFTQHDAARKSSRQGFQGQTCLPRPNHSAGGVVSLSIWANGQPPAGPVALLPQRFPKRQRHAAAEDGTRRTAEGLSGVRQPLSHLYGLPLPCLVTPASTTAAAGEILCLGYQPVIEAQFPVANWEEDTATVFR
ncbi:hypothetical protein MTO96_025877 [Rhipicephalus appendiculatus]